MNNVAITFIRFMVSIFRVFYFLIMGSKLHALQENAVTAR